MVGKSWETRVGLGMTYFLASKSLRSSPSMLSLIMPRNFTYVLNQLRMDTMAQCTSPTLSNSMTNPPVFSKALRSLVYPLLVT
ncbi:hypothetical protein V3481_013709 [Fusarium oxysporum f. sp. vasinfectum]